MQRVNEFQLYELANAVHPLVDLSNDSTYRQSWLDIYSAKTALLNLFNQRALEVCLNPANELYEALRAVVPDDFNDATQKLSSLSSPEPTLGYVAYTIRECVKKFETVLSAELSNSDTYWISPKGTHRTSFLMTSARNELPPAILKTVPQDAAAELDEAGRCLLFDVPTAAASHLFRATESVVRKYYEFVVGAVPAMKLRNWGAYIAGLKKKDADDKITAYLEHIRTHYRNPVLHPEVLLSSDEAQVLFGVCISAIVMMEKAMYATTPKLPLSAAVGLPVS